MFDFYLNYEYWFAATQLALAMLGMGATLKVRDFVAVAKNPWAISVGVVVQVLAVPLVAYVLLAVFSLIHAHGCRRLTGLEGWFIKVRRTQLG